MPKKTVKSKAKAKQAKGNQISVPVGIIITLSVALIVAIVIAVCAIVQFKSFNNSLNQAKLETFDHIAEMYIKDMEFTTGNNQPTVKQATGYGVSDEDGVLYITFDFAPYPTGDAINFTSDDLDFRHAIVYFQWDPERSTYGHAFGYYDDASYHPDGTYVKFEEK